MLYYKVRAKEIHYQTILVEAESAEDAVAKASQGEGDLLGCEYSHTEEYIDAAKAPAPTSEGACGGW